MELPTKKLDKVIEDIDKMIPQAKSNTADELKEINKVLVGELTKLLIIKHSI